MPGLDTVLHGHVLILLLYYGLDSFDMCVSRSLLFGCCSSLLRLPDVCTFGASDVLYFLNTILPGINTIISY